MSIVSTRLMGGLGNMMFQVATAYSVALRDNKEMICDNRGMIIPHKPYTSYTNNIFRKIIFSDKLFVQNNFNEEGFQYRPIPNIYDNIKLLGYFQSEKYFINHKKELLKLFEIDKDTNTYLLGKYGKVLKQDTCSIHIRRGDYLSLPNHHPTQSIDYYINSINIIGEDKHFLIFSDDIKWCEKNFDFIKNKTFVLDNLDYQDLYLMSMCNNNIIANSTFSWWGAWLNNSLTKIVITPKNWFGSAYKNYDTNDLYCKGWIKI
jgi:hypothetical protein